MLFSSITFLFYFLPLFLLAYACLPWRNAVLLIASLIFFAWGDPPRITLLLACIVLNWGFGLALARDVGRRPITLAFGVAANLGLLIWFKYLGFLGQQANALLAAIGGAPVSFPEVVLPLGISFFTFQGISYLIDVHRGDVRAQPSLMKFAVYKSMFPPLIAGPIVRYATIAGSLDVRRVNRIDLREGAQQFIIGLAQKVLLANTIAGPVDRLFAQPPGSLDMLAAWVAAAGYALQIYFDFAGYSNMAIGLGRILGFTFPRNFDRPYASRSVGEFWRRWHMTLSAWFRDYVYIPLGGNRRGSLRTGCNLLAVFLLCGLWHGASWNFAIWGLYHGAFLVAERIGLGRVLARLPRVLSHAYLVLVVVVGWVPFRADTLGDTASMLAAMAGLSPGGFAAGQVLGNSVLAALVSGAIFSVLPLAPRTRARPVMQAACLVLFVLSAASLAAGTYNPFIYFRF